MSVRKEREETKKPEKKPLLKNASTSKKTKLDSSREQNVEESSEKVVKAKVSLNSLRDKLNYDKASSLEKIYRKKTDAVKKERKIVPDGSSGKRTLTRIKTDSKPDVVYYKDLQESKLSKKVEDKKDADKRSTKVDEARIQNEVKELKPKSKRDRTRTRTLSPTEIKQLLPSKIASGIFKKLEPEVGKEVEDKPESESEDNKDDENYEDDFEDYESDFEKDDSAASEAKKSETQEETNRSMTPENISPEMPRKETVSTTAITEESKTASITLPTKTFTTELKTSSIAMPTTASEPIFRNYASPQKTEDESKMKSISAELWKSNARKKEVEEIKKCIERENIEVDEKTFRSTIKDSEEQNSNSESLNKKEKKSCDIDFSTANKKQKKQKEIAAAKKRGEELLSMISLDAVTYNILEIPPIPYESYMKVFGRKNSKQVYTQTNEDNMEEEIQTDEISACNKWTQNPAEYLGQKKNENNLSYVLSQEERLGVGGDDFKEENKNEEIVVQSNDSKLLDFLSWSSQVVLEALERKSGNYLNLKNMPNHSKSMTFGDGYIKLKTDGIPFLENKSISCLSTLNKSCEKLISTHVDKNKHFQRSVICVWSLRELSKPLKILVASNLVTSCCFGPNRGDLVFAGLSDGSICLWDLREPSLFHNTLSDDQEWVLRSPTYTTAGNLNPNDSLSTVVSIQLLKKTESYDEFNDFSPLQVCSLDKNGIVTIWSVIHTDASQRNEPLDDLGLAPWGRLKLVESTSFCIFESLRNEIPGLYITCYDMLINEEEDDGFYIANSFGSVHHCSNYGSLMKPQFFVPSKQDAIIETTCLELCPFDSNYFLAGCGDGSVRLHSRHQEKPLITLNFNVFDGQKESPVVSLSWMHLKPCIFLVLDSKSRIHIWNLGVSDMYPEMSFVLTEKKICSMKLLSISDPKQVPFIVIGTEDGSLELHRLRQEYTCKSITEVRNEMKIFLKYVSIL